MRYVVNFNAQATELLGTATDRVEFLPATNARLKANTVIKPASEDGVAFSPEKPNTDSLRRKVRLSETAARTAGLRGSHRYTLVRRGKGEAFYLVPHSQVRSSKGRRIDEPSITISITERAA